LSDERMHSAAQQRDAQAAAGLHQQRGLAESFGVDPERYDRTRPSYPPQLIDRIIAASPGQDVLDVGIGTGTSARPFRAAGCAVLGVEPDPRMATFAREQGFAVEVATFEQWDSAGRSFDLVVSGQAWHWVDPVAGAAKAARLLRDNGRLALFWNAAEYPPAIRDVYRRTLPGTVLSQAGRRDSYPVFYDQAEDGILRTGSFTRPQRWLVDWTATYTRDQWLDQVPTFGGHSQLPVGKLDELLAGFAATIDTLGGQITVDYTAGAVTAARTAR
jgi:SAM-dependent methyltransferase